MIETEERVYQNFKASLNDLKNATALTKAEKAQQLASQVDILSRTKRGQEFLFDHCLETEEAGIFDGSSWSEPQKQTPVLVKGTLLSGHPHSSIEILSELRILAYALGKKKHPNFSSAEAFRFIEETLVHNLEFAFDELTESSRLSLTQQERRKVVLHFQFLLDRAPLVGIKVKLADEIHMVCAQRPIVTQTVRNLIQTIFLKMELDPAREIDRQLQHYVHAVYAPSPLSTQFPNYAQYQSAIENADEEVIRQEADSMGAFLEDTGLTNPYLAMLLRHVIQHLPHLLKETLHLTRKGVSEWERYQDFVTKLCLDTFSAANYRGIYGMKRMLEIHLFSRRPVRAGLTNLNLIHIHPHTEKRILRSEADQKSEVSAKQRLMGALIGILGQPLGIGQGNNATCQSARGISMWAQHAPAKLIDMITTVATSNNLIMRFENEDLESLKLSKGLVDKLDYNLDALSVTIVPHLDKIYSEMMRRSAGRMEDAHKWTNPALYGHWVHFGFASAYSYLTNSIQDYKGFVRVFYSSLHPVYNGGREMVYPNPIGIFITNSKGDMLGFHAVSLLRIDEYDGQYRGYFLNPNNEGRQNWGQGIEPSVFGHGEKHGESSLPIHQLMARIYAFHYGAVPHPGQVKPVPKEEIDKVERLAQESWGRSYSWSDIEKIW